MSPQFSLLLLSAAAAAMGVVSDQLDSGLKSSWMAVANSVAADAASSMSSMSSSSSSSSMSSGEGEGDEGGKPTKYHYYPHNQHLYLLPECATQQVCSAVYLRLNYSQPLCACPAKPCSVSTRTDDRHTIPLVTGPASQVLTLVKTCEPSAEVRECNKAKDWSILALQNSRTGKAHYLVICRCPSPGYLQGPIPHSQPAYARVPGIRVYGMTCVRSSSSSNTSRARRLGEGSSKTKMKKKKKAKTNTSTSTEANKSGGLLPWERLKGLFHTALNNS